MATSSGQIKVGIISANWGTMAHLPAWRGLPDIDVVGICTSRRETAEAAAQNFNIPRPYWDYHAMVAAPDIDIIDCGTRPNIRRGMVLASFAQGKHVYNGIPFADSFDSARLLIEAHRASGRIAMVDAFTLWVPGHRLMKEMIDDGYLGRAVQVNLEFHLPLFNPPQEMIKGFSWFAEPENGASALRNLGSHGLHMLFHLFGMPVALVAVDSRHVDEWRFESGDVFHPKVNDTATVLLQFADGMTAIVRTCWTPVAGKGWSLDVQGTGGRLRTEAPMFPTQDDTKLFAAKRGDFVLTAVTIPERYETLDGVDFGDSYPLPHARSMALGMRTMVDAIRGTSNAVQPDFEQAWAVARILEAARRSVAEHGWVRLDTVA
jgi:predicted dehydrogenase